MCPRTINVVQEIEFRVFWKEKTVCLTFWWLVDRRPSSPCEGSFWLFLAGFHSPSTGHSVSRPCNFSARERERAAFMFALRKIYGPLCALCVCQGQLYALLKIQLPLRKCRCVKRKAATFHIAEHSPTFFTLYLAAARPPISINPALSRALWPRRRRRHLRFLAVPTGARFVQHSQIIMNLISRREDEILHCHLAIKLFVLKKRCKGVWLPKSFTRGFWIQQGIRYCGGHIMASKPQHA